MQRSDSPSSVYSQDSSMYKRRPSRTDNRYKLFPSVEPTPPTSPQSLQKQAFQKAQESLRRRSTSYDEIPRLAPLRYSKPPKGIATRRGRKVSLSEVKPMSTVQEIPMDSPTVPLEHAPHPRLVDEIGHGRSNSAPEDFHRDYEDRRYHELHSVRAMSAPMWPGRRTSSPSPVVHGLGLSFMEAGRYEGPSHTRRSSDTVISKPTLRIDTSHNNFVQARDVPPAVPPKDTIRRASYIQSQQPKIGHPPTSGSMASPERASVVRNGTESAPAHNVSPFIDRGTERWFPRSAGARAPELTGTHTMDRGWEFPRKPVPTSKNSEQGSPVEVAMPHAHQQAASNNAIQGAEPSPAASAKLTADSRSPSRLLSTLMKPVSSDPLKAFEDLTAQTQTLHARYVKLRADRQRIHGDILTSLKLDKATPSYVNGLLDQQLSLAVVTASLDVCVAMLKSLDARKVKALEAFIAQSKNLENTKSVVRVQTVDPEVSSPEEPEIKTPRATAPPLPTSGAKQGTLQTIQVYMSDDIFQYYESTTR